MAVRWGLGPVFASDCLTTTRRWQVYAGRATLVGSVLVVIMVAWLNHLSGNRHLDHADRSWRRSLALDKPVFRHVYSLGLDLLV